MIAQIILIGVMVLAAGGAWISHNRSEQAIGEARKEAEYQKQQKEQEERNALKALEGEKYALELLAKAEQRNRKQAQQIRELAATRRSQDDERAKVDPEFKAWSDGIVPAYASNRVRERTVALTAAAASRVVPAASGLGVAAPAAGPAAGPADESPIARIRAWVTGHLRGGVDGGE